MGNVEAAGGRDRISEILPSTLLLSGICALNHFQTAFTVIGETDSLSVTVMDKPETMAGVLEGCLVVQRVTVVTLYL